MSLFEENAEILRRLAAEGIDLGPPRQIDFSHVFPDRASAEAFAHAVASAGFSTAIEEIQGEEYPWDVTTSREMEPTCEKITESEKRLDAMARSHHGRSDGWGFFMI